MKSMSIANIAKLPTQVLWLQKFSSEEILGFQLACESQLRQEPLLWFSHLLVHFIIGQCFNINKILRSFAQI